MRIINAAVLVSLTGGVIERTRNEFDLGRSPTNIGEVPVPVANRESRDELEIKRRDILGALSGTYEHTGRLSLVYPERALFTNFVLKNDEIPSERLRGPVEFGIRGHMGMGIGYQRLWFLEMSDQFYAFMDSERISPFVRDEAGYAVGRFMGLCFTQGIKSYLRFDLGMYQDILDLRFGHEEHWKDSVVSGFDSVVPVSILLQRGMTADELMRIVQLPFDDGDE